VLHRYGCDDLDHSGVAPSSWLSTPRRTHVCAAARAGEAWWEHQLHYDFVCELVYGRKIKPPGDGAIWTLACGAPLPEHGALVQYVVVLLWCLPLLALPLFAGGGGSTKATTTATTRATESDVAPSEDTEPGTPASKKKEQ
jgi:hypothetical protein